MAKFLISGSYTAEGAKGLMKEGGSGRKAVVQKALEGLGGKIESIYYTFGAADVIVICDVPDAVSALALSIAANSSGTVRISTTPLLSVEEVDAACKKTTAYRGAGA
ncbi:MAG: GYD domain-containing protein [Vicinamibacterales bacterium]